MVRMAWLWFFVAMGGCTGNLVEEDAPGSDGGPPRGDMRVDPGEDGGPPPRDDGGVIVLPDGGPAEDAGGGCAAGTTDCGGTCIDTGADPENCGMCGRRCAEGATCSGGTCMGGVGCPPAPGGASANAAAAIERTNEVRTAMGLQCQEMITEINTAARLHCEYYAANSGMCTANAHREVMGCEQFVGVQFDARMRAAGYVGAPVFENMHFIHNGASAVQGWIDSVWHRTPVLSPWVGHSGYGAVPGCDTMDYGRGTTLPPDTIATYPYANQTDVPPSFSGREGPPPPEPPTGWPSGYPITIYFQGDITEHVLTEQGSTTPIEHVWLAAGSTSLLRTEHVLYANDPLARSTTYAVHIEGTDRSGDPVTLDWTFTTR